MRSNLSAVICTEPELGYFTIHSRHLIEAKDPGSRQGIGITLSQRLNGIFAEKAQTSARRAKLSARPLHSRIS